MNRWIVGSLACVAVALAVLLALAPQLPALVLEGYPSLVWSGRGSYAPVTGVATTQLVIAPDAGEIVLDPRLQAAFDESGGKAIVVYRDGEIVLEHYGSQVTADTRLNSYSMAKGIISALIFRAIADGRIADIEATLGDLLPEASGLADVSLVSLLEMRSGIVFDGGGMLGEASGKAAETAPSPFSPLAKLHFLGLAPLVGGLEVSPGATHEFNYQNINTALLGAVLERAYGRGLEELLAEKLWQPAGAHNALWRRTTETSPVSAYCCLYASARDWVAIGAYLAANGRPDAPFLPTDLWRAYLGLDITTPEREVDHYGMQVRQNILDREGEPLQGPFSYFFGQGGQVLYMMPEQGVVVFRSGDREQLLHSTLYWSWDSLPPRAVQEPKLSPAEP
jgi:CubicO group peptidase (beta-lactamase class C family)